MTKPSYISIHIVRNNSLFLRLDIYYVYYFSERKFSSINARYWLNFKVDFDRGGEINTLPLLVERTILAKYYENYRIPPNE